MREAIDIYLEALDDEMDSDISDDQ